MRGSVVWDDVRSPQVGTTLYPARVARMKNVPPVWVIGALLVLLALLFLTWARG
jgi:hypothetical protein